MVLCCSRILNPGKALGGSMTHRHQRSLKWQHQPWTSTWPLVVTRTVATNTDRPKCGPQQEEEPRYHLGPRWQHRTLISIWPPQSSTDSGHKYGFSLQHRPWTSTWPLVATRIIDVSTCPWCSRAWIYHDLRWQPRPLRPVWLLVAAWPRDINVAPGDCTDHGPLHGFLGSLW